MARIIVAGALANKPCNGGAAWTRLSWALGFQRLGHDVLFVEQIAPATCVDRTGAPCRVEDSINLAYFTAVTERFGLPAALVVDGERRSVVLSWDEIVHHARTTDVLVNISGHLTVDALKAPCRKRIFIDLDPGYTQFWHADGFAEDRFRDHHVYFTVGENIGRSSCTIPTGPVMWRPIRQPVLLDEWPVAPRPAGPMRFTTVASWRGPLGRVQHGATLFGVKAHEFRHLLSLPSRSGHTFEIALEVDAADQPDVDSLKSHGWHVADPRRVAGDPVAFRDYVRGSGAEFSVAQGIYVATRSGWFSDRTVRYLASGKPALVQDTGWSENYPGGRGLVGFRTLAEAADGAERIARDYTAHAAAARAIAEEFFDSRKVLSALLSAVDAGVANAPAEAGGAREGGQ